MSIQAITRGSRALSTEQDPRWSAVVGCDASADGTFYYSVATTGVYCYPSCRSRLANPKNVRFHATREDAERAGFRACRRCKPDRDGKARLRAADTLQVAAADSTLGVVLVALSAKGITAVLLGDDRQAARLELERRFPGATLVGGDASVTELAAKVAAMIESPALGSELAALPLDLRGTEFQKAVWHALREIPAGSTASYTDIASRMGLPKAVRAVAQACASNTLAVLVPCHRVVRSNGSLAGYRWGVERKRALLEREAAA
jgi:AraC family transcriptional regulator, regulatory protein of adaptative response / methylated-DNA-[protein]-cysteine methyltransferase